MSKFKREFKNVVYNYTDAEAKVREATSNDPWGPSGAVMTELAEYTYHVQAYGLVMGMLWKRLNDHGKNWRHVYKSLVLLDYLVKSGSDRVTAQCKDNIFSIQTLKDFQYVDKDGKDQGTNIREKAKGLVALLKDEEALKEERKKALLTRQRQAAISGTDGDSTPPKSRVKFADGAKATDGTASAPPPTGAAAGPHRLEQDVEQARPTDMSEEEMQLKLALQLSKQQADEEERIKSAEDDSLRVALELSKQEAGEDETTATESPPLDNNLLLDFSETGLADPWSDSAPPPEPPPSYDTLVDPFASTTEDPFAGSTPVVTSDPFAGSTPVVTSDPFGPSSGVDPFATANGLFENNSTIAWSSSGQSTTTSTTPAASLWSSDALSANPFDLSTLTSDLPPLNNSNESKEPQARIEDQFLGSDFGNLVDLDSLTIPPPILSNPNPFGGPSTAGSANPFDSNKPTAPSLVQLANSGFTASELLPAPMVALGSGSPNSGRSNPFS